MNALFWLGLAAAAFGVAGCGVKGPPLPPEPKTPQKSDQSWSPNHASPTPSASPAFQRSDSS